MTTDWEKEFDEKFLGNEALDLLKPTNARHVKDFIRTKIEEAYKVGEKKGRPAPAPATASSRDCGED